MTTKTNEIYKHCFAHICASGATTMLMNLDEVLRIYTDSMKKDLEDCGVVATREQVAQYITEQYHLLQEIKIKNDVAV